MQLCGLDDSTLLGAQAMLDARASSHGLAGQQGGGPC